jgi:hypothetical protein
MDWPATTTLISSSPSWPTAIDDRRDLSSISGIPADSSYRLLRP